MAQFMRRNPFSRSGRFSRLCSSGSQGSLKEEIRSCTQAHSGSREVGCRLSPACHVIKKRIDQLEDRKAPINFNKTEN
jgi:hypothetical protein